MSTTREFYLKQAERDEQVAADSTLDNVRERSLRSAESWRMMAARLERAEALKQSRMDTDEPAPVDPAGWPVDALRPNQAL